MAKNLYGYRIGSDVKEKEAPTGVKLVPDNKTLMAIPLNDDHDDDVTPVRLKSVKEIFEHYKPSREVELKTEGDASEELVLKFNKLSDFSKDGIIEQSKVLQDQEEKTTIYSRMVDVLQNNGKLQTVIGNEEYKKEFLELLETLIEEINESE